MEKNEVLKDINEKIKQLSNKYRMACSDMSVDGKMFTKGGSAVLRARLKKEICILTLIKELIEHPNARNINDENSCIALERLLGKK